MGDCHRFFLFVFLFDRFQLSVVSLTVLGILARCLVLVIVVVVVVGGGGGVTAADLTYLLCYIGIVFSFIRIQLVFLLLEMLYSFFTLPQWFLSHFGIFGYTFIYQSPSTALFVDSIFLTFTALQGCWNVLFYPFKVESNFHFLRNHWFVKC